MIRRLGLGVLVTVTALSGIARMSPSAPPKAKSPHVLAAVAAPASAPTRLTDAQISERVFDFGDRLQAVDYQLGFTGDARDAAATASACQALLADHVALRSALDRVRNRTARDLGAELLRAAASTVDACSSTPPANDAASAERAYNDFARYRNLAFDFADLVSR